MNNLTNLVLKKESVIKNFDKELLMHWNEPKSISLNLVKLLNSKHVLNIDKKQAIHYVELFNLINTKDDAEYFIELLNHNLHNEESIGLLLNAAYLVYLENNFTEGLQIFFDWLLNYTKHKHKNNPQFFMIGSKYLL